MIFFKNSDDIGQKQRITSKTKLKSGVYRANREGWSLCNDVMVILLGHIISQKSQKCLYVMEKCIEQCKNNNNY